MNIHDHILRTTGVPTCDEPPATRGDMMVFVFCVGIALGLLVGRFWGGV